MIEPNNPILTKMLDRLFISMMDGPSMNCRPHASRQRLDLLQLEKLKDMTAGEILLKILKEGEAKLTARVPIPSRAHKSDHHHSSKAAREEEKAAQEAWSEQYVIRNKLRLIAEDARTYEQDTGVHALNIGFPLISLPPGTFGGRAGAGSRRILAPIAFIPLAMTVKAGSKQALDLTRRAESGDLVVPNIALLAWLEQQSGRPLPDLSDSRDENIWDQICELTRIVAGMVECSAPPELDGAFPTQLQINATPRQDDGMPQIVTACVLGLYPSANQGLLRDTREMLARGCADGPISNFVRLGVSLDAPNPAAQEKIKAAAAAVISKRVFAEEKMITDADPCQARAVRLARESRGLVVHGPPGTGKSQTITNIISDHLGRGQRVLFVSDKRTALDVVADRLNVQGLGDFCATVHDPRHDQRELYRSVREQLDGLVDAPLKPGAADQLAKVDAELQVLHDDLNSYHRLLIGTNGGQGSFHHLVGLWLAELSNSQIALDDRLLKDLPFGDLDKHGTRLKEVLERGEQASYATNPWKEAGGVALIDFLSTSMESYRSAMAECLRDAHEVDATRNPLAPAFSPDADLQAEAEARGRLANQLRDVLAKLKPGEAAVWAARPDQAIAAAKERIARMRDWINVLRSRRLDQTLLSMAPKRASANQLARDRETLTQYVNAFQSLSNDFARVRRSARNADDATILRWIRAGRKNAASALKKLSAAAPIAKAVDESNLDASLLAQLGRSPLEPRQIVEFLAALNSYSDVSSKWYAGLCRDRVKGADAVVKHFGLSLNSTSAATVREFLSRLQQRMDLAAAIESVTGTKFENAFDDGELLTEFRRQLDVVEVLGAAEEHKTETIRPEAMNVADDVVEGLNALIKDEADPAAKLLGEYQLRPTPSDAARLEQFLKGLEARIRLTQVHEQLTEAPATDLVADDVLLKSIESYDAMFELLETIRANAGSPAVIEAITKALSEPGSAQGAVQALAESSRRVIALAKLEKSMAAAGLFEAKWLKQFTTSVRAGAVAAEQVLAFSERLGSLEGVLRVQDGLSRLPAALSEAAAFLLTSQTRAVEGHSAIRRAVLAGEIGRRLRAEPDLQAVDGFRFQTAFDRYRELAEKKHHLVRDTIRHTWASRQKNRLLASEGTRLNGIGADLRRRITGRGERAMRLRQVIAHGAAVEGGDPLFELRPCWMASPETVAQLFPREQIFDVVVFDEASQCRLEDSLPVLTRAKRVVIAGDPQQLPPTRFFESTVAVSEDEEVETDQELFEAHQGEVEDLLGAALGLDVQQCYLDVHYRSKNADLIGFSNQHFYHSRLQPIPDHPRNRGRHAPLTLYRVDGMYDKRKNEQEADAVIRIVKDLLGRSNPPSIGIACFNLQQRDMIIEKLEDAAEADPDFANKLLAARGRRGAGSSEGLFVKNLENVQGDERDHLIISTTFGPDAKGKFRRNFGPLGSPGGGRRLNVLVTRARHEIHVVTSIPRSAYASLPPIPDGQQPSGVWLLFAYLFFVEQLYEDYETAYRVIQNAGGNERAMIEDHKTRTPSNFSRALAHRLQSAHNTGSTVHWGNEGFCVDLALHHPHRAEDVSLGVLVDTTRFSGNNDAVEWEVFRASILEAQGWKLHRVWTPHFFRDPNGCLRQIVEAAHAAVDAEKHTAPAQHLEPSVITGPSIRDAIAPPQHKDAA